MKAVDGTQEANKAMPCILGVWLDMATRMKDEPTKACGTVLDNTAG